MSGWEDVSESESAAKLSSEASSSGMKSSPAWAGPGGSPCAWPGVVSMVILMVLRGRLANLAWDLWDLAPAARLTGTQLTAQLASRFEVEVVRSEKNR